MGRNRAQEGGLDFGSRHPVLFRQAPAQLARSEEHTSELQSLRHLVLPYTTLFRSHDALDALWVGIVRKKVGWILDLDIRSFFDKLQHNWLVQIVEHRIGDKRVVRDRKSTRLN